MTAQTDLTLLIEERIRALVPGRAIGRERGKVSEVISNQRIAMVTLGGSTTPVPVFYPALPVTLAVGDDVLVERSPGWLAITHVLGRDFASEITGEWVSNLSASPANFRLIAGDYGVILRNDGSNTYVLLTAAGDQHGIWNALRPLYFNDASGDVTMGQNATVVGKATLATVNGGGSAFPGSPATNDRYYRTDLKMEYVWDGTQWVSTQLFMHPFVDFEGKTQPLSATTSNLGRIGLLGQAVFLESIIATFFVSSGGSALSGSHKWDLSWNTDPGSVSLGTAAINSGSSSVWRTVTSSVTNLVIASTDLEFVFASATKTGTPGNLRALATAYYRRIAT